LCGITLIVVVGIVCFFFFSCCVDSIQNDRRQFSKKKKVNKSNKIPMEEDEGDKWKVKSLVRALFDPLRPASDWRLNWHGWLYSDYYT
jgi:hypothetical protein